MTTALDRPLAELSDRELRELLDGLRADYDALLQAGFRLDLTRGKPSTAQLDLANTLLQGPDGFRAADGTDVRNYGGADGLAEMRDIVADLLGVPAKNVIAGGNSSLELMYDCLVACLLHGTGSDAPWRDEAVRTGNRVAMIAPVPGYDRHFEQAEHLGIELLAVELGEHGPDVAECARLAADSRVKGMWVVPTYANPNGVVYDEATTRGLLAMDAADGFRIFWDNAYAVHHLTDAEPAPLPVLELAEQEGHPDRVFQFCSTSKMTFAGAGVAAFSSSPANVEWFRAHSSVRTIGPDKVNQLRHAQFFEDADGVRRHMRKHRALLAPKFEAAESVLRERLGAADVARWTQPAGGYFISLDVTDGTASRVVELASAAGLQLTPAGSAYPGGHDPRNRNIRLAPSFPPLPELHQAMEVVATCVLLAAAEQRASREDDAREQG